ncbi:unnamed protein product [Acidithrix sp. C25]|nr:unnamed protein product [Acidithrix sp. C25]
MRLRDKRTKTLLSFDVTNTGNSASPNRIVSPWRINDDMDLSFLEFDDP